MKAKFLEEISDDSSFVGAALRGRPCSEHNVERWRSGACLPAPLALRSWRSASWCSVSTFDFDSLGGNTDDDVIRLDVPRDHGPRAHHRAIADLRTRKHGRVIRDANVVSDPRSRGLDVVDVVDVVIVRVDVCVV